MVAFGDSRYVYRMPSYADYIRDYFSEENEMTAELILSFIAKQALSTPIPIKKHLTKINAIQGMIGEKIILVKRCKKYETFLDDNQKLVISQKDIPRFKKECNPQKIYHLDDIKERNKLKYIIKNMMQFQLDGVTTLINEILQTKSDKIISGTEYRKLFMAYSILLE